jgi:hypothetical protein
MKQAVRWNTEITATVPLDATTRTRLRVAPTALRLGRYVKATGLLTPTGLAGRRVKLSVQVRKGATWASVKQWGDAGAGAAYAAARGR